MTEPVSTEKKEIKKLIEVNEELENYFRNTIIPQLFVDADLVLRKYSPPANRHFKFTATDIGKSIHEIPSLMRLPDVLDDIKEVIRKNEDLEKEIQTHEGQWFQMNILPYIIKKQNITNGVVITFIDITDRINDKKDIERLNADHETFIYSISHDFRGPLTNLVLLIELLKAAVATDKKKEVNELIELMSKSALAMKTLISDLTDISRIGSELSGSKSVLIEGVLDEVKFMLKDQIYKTHAKITTSLTVPEVIFSRKNLRSILYNLISNAIKFTLPEKTPEILIKTEQSDPYTLLSVKDNGVGIEEDKQKEIFSKFTRLQPEVAGTGVGLFIVNKMIDNQGGKIEVESKVDSGTTFTIYLKH